MNYNIPVSWYWKKDFLSGRSPDKLEQEIKDSDFLVADAKGTRRMIGLKYDKKIMGLPTITCICTNFEMPLAKSIAFRLGKIILFDEKISVRLCKNTRGETLNHEETQAVSCASCIPSFFNLLLSKKDFNPISVDDTIYLYGQRLRNFFTVKDLEKVIGNPDVIDQNCGGSFQTYFWSKHLLFAYSCKRTSGIIFKIELLEFKREQIGDILLNSIKEDGYVQDGNVVFTGKIEKCEMFEGLKTENLTIELRDARVENSKLLYEHDSSKLNMLIKKTTIKFRDKFYKGTMLHYAAGNDNIALLKALIKNGADINAKDAFGDTAYDVAVNQNKMAAANFFRKLGMKKV